MTLNKDHVKQAVKRAAKAWDSKTVNKPALSRIRWWESERIVGHVNRKICGSPLQGVGSGLVEIVKQKSPRPLFEKGLSIACGTASKEFKLLKMGLVDHFDLYEISKERIKIIHRNAKKQNLVDRISVFTDDFFSKDITSHYNFVHWHSALHHMFDANLAVVKSKQALKPGGCFYMFDFVGKKRFQWSDEELYYINAFRSALPEFAFFNPETGGKWPRIILRPSVELFIKYDPSEAADSESILPSIKRHFSCEYLQTVGGVIYNTGLKNVLHNISEDSEILTIALQMDDLLDENGYFQYAAALAFKK